MTYCQVPNYLLATYATDDVIMDVEVKITNFKQQKEMSVVRYSDVL